MNFGHNKKYNKLFLAFLTIFLMIPCIIQSGNCNFSDEPCPPARRQNPAHVAGRTSTIPSAASNVQLVKIRCRDGSYRTTKVPLRPGDKPDRRILTAREASLGGRGERVSVGNRIMHVHIQRPNNNHGRRR